MHVIVCYIFHVYLTNFLVEKDILHCHTWVFLAQVGQMAKRAIVII